MNQIEIRSFDLEDYESVISLWKSTEGIGLSEADSKENITRFLQKNPGLSLVALKYNELVGAVLCGHDGRRGYLHHLAVRKDQRLKGLGNALVRKCMQNLKEDGIHKCHIFVFRDNEQGIQFWTKNNWQARLELQIMSRYTLE